MLLIYKAWHVAELHQFIITKLTIFAFLYSSDFKTNEKKIMGQLDDLAKVAGAKKKKGDMKGAVEGTEAIREWVSGQIT